MTAYGTENADYAAKKAYVLKKNSEVSAYIEKGLEEVRTKARIDAQKILELLANVAFTSPAAFAKITEEKGKQKILWQDFDTLPDDVKSAIAVIKNTPSGILVETLDRMKAIDLLMKYMGLNHKEKTGVYFEGEEKLEE